MSQDTAISRPPTQREILTDRVFRGLTWAFAWMTVLLVVYILAEIGGKAAPAIKERGLAFMTETTWDPNQDVYGILPHIWGTLYSSVLALIIGTIFGLAVAIFLSERFLSSAVYSLLKVFGLQ